MDDQHFCEPIGPRRHSYVADDYSIQSTNDDAVLGKASAVQLGYFQDPYIRYFVKSPERKSPEIHRGYYARVTAVKTLVDKFLKIAGPDAQILNLGAGFDTLYWRLCAEDAKFRKLVEIDFSSITAKKIYHVTKPHCSMKSMISDDDKKIVQCEHRDLFGPRYCLIGADIRDTKELQARLHDQHLSITDFDTQRPTLIIAECVLLYMSSEESANLVQFLSETFTNACFINYDLVNLDDKFGQVFKDNMSSRGLTLSGINACKNLDSQNDRFLKAKWPHVKSYLMAEVYEKFIPQNERQRIEAIEFLDEKELLCQLLHHYCIVIATNNANKFGTNFHF